MYHEESIFDKVAFDKTDFNPEYSNPQLSEKSGIDIYTVLVIGAIVVIITAIGTFYLTREIYGYRSINWLG
jgi:hypothetical protein